MVEEGERMIMERSEKIKNELKIRDINKKGWDGLKDSDVVM